ncbi:MAG: hypothetical protein WKG00_06525 [Polyangiaceae bacterium]
MSAARAHPRGLARVWTAPAAALLALALAAALLASAGLSCGRQGSGFVCTCTYLTDRDDEYQVKVEVCAKSAEDALGKAKDCAADSPAPIQRCQCIAVEGGQCKLGECKKPEKK